jgi:hypothetical protein
MSRPPRTSALPADADLGAWRSLLAGEADPREREARRRCRQGELAQLLRVAATLVLAAGRALPEDAPVRLAAAPDRSNTHLRWRSRQPGSDRGRRLELDDPLMLACLAGLSQSTRRQVLDIDRARIALNVRIATLRYERTMDGLRMEADQRRARVMHQFLLSQARSSP